MEWSCSIYLFLTLKTCRRRLLLGYYQEVFYYPYPTCLTGIEIHSVCFWLILWLHDSIVFLEPPAPQRKPGLSCLMPKTNLLNNNMCDCGSVVLHTVVYIPGSKMFLTNITKHILGMESRATWEDCAARTLQDPLASAHTQLYKIWPTESSLFKS